MAKNNIPGVVEHCFKCKIELFYVCVCVLLLLCSFWYESWEALDYEGKKYLLKGNRQMCL